MAQLLRVKTEQTQAYKLIDLSGDLKSDSKTIIKPIAIKVLFWKASLPFVTSFLTAGTCKISLSLKPIFHLATLFARREAKTRIRQRDWLKLAGEKIRCEQVGSAFLLFCEFARTNSPSGSWGFSQVCIAYDALPYLWLIAAH